MKTEHFPSLTCKEVSYTFVSAFFGKVEKTGNQNFPLIPFICLSVKIGTVDCLAIVFVACGP